MMHIRLKTLLLLVSPPLLLVTAAYIQWGTVGLPTLASIPEPTPATTVEPYGFPGWRRGSVIASWLLDLTALALLGSPDLADFKGRVSDSGEGRWTVVAAIDESAPAPVISAALCDRFSSRGEADFADKVLSAMRYAFGGHVENAGTPTGGVG